MDPLLTASWDIDFPAYNEDITMRKHIFTGLFLILITSVLSGCSQDAPVASTPVETQNPVLAAGEYVLPAAFTGEWTGVDGFLHVTADAKVETPYGLKIPIAAVEKKQITQEDADKLMDEFIGDAQLYKEYRGDWADMPENYEEKISRKLQKNPFQSYELKGSYAETELGRAHIQIENNQGFPSSFIFSVNRYGDLNHPKAFETAKTPPLSEADAMAAAEVVLNHLGLQHYLCQEATPVAYLLNGPTPHNADGAEDFFQTTGYNLRYVPGVEGCPAAILDQAYGSSREENLGIDSSWTFETIDISINANKEIVFFKWYSPQEKPELISEKAKLLPFLEISSCFPDLIMTKNRELSEINAINGFDVYTEVRVDKVELNFMRIRDKYNFEEGIYIPVWDFWGTTSSYTEDEDHFYINNMEPQHEIVLTINALDGTIVDRELGY